MMKGSITRMEDGGLMFEFERGGRELIVVVSTTSIEPVRFLLEDQGNLVRTGHVQSGTDGERSTAESLQDLLRWVD